MMKQIEKEIVTVDRNRMTKRFQMYGEKVVTVKTTAGKGEKKGE